MAKPRDRLSSARAPRATPRYATTTTRAMSWASCVPGVRERCYCCGLTSSAPPSIGNVCPVTYPLDIA